MVEKKRDPGEPEPHIEETVTEARQAEPATMPWRALVIGLVLAVVVLFGVLIFFWMMPTPGASPA
jgi:hypothetical protein